MLKRKENLLNLEKHAAAAAAAETATMRGLNLDWCRLAHCCYLVAMIAEIEVIVHRMRTVSAGKKGFRSADVAEIATRVVMRMLQTLLTSGAGCRSYPNASTRK